MSAILCLLLQLYTLVLFVRIALSWIPGSTEGALGSVSSFVYALTEPVLAPVRAALPPVRVGGVGFDVSVIIVMVLVILLRGFVC